MSYQTSPYSVTVKLRNEQLGACKKVHIPYFMMRHWSSHSFTLLL